jgi:molybdopterin-guanine dinucleotide biosynthesis protein MobB
VVNDLQQSRLDSLPVLGICGCSGAGKTTLIEALIPRMQDMGLQVAVVKHGAHNVQVDAPGKDSDRFFQAGADVFLFGEECFSRRHEDNFLSHLESLASLYDIILVEGHAGTAIPKIWLLGAGHTVPPENQGRVLEVFTREQAQVDHLFGYLQQWLRSKCRQSKVWGCVLIGGQSRRMGRPKHLIEYDNKTWLEYTVDKLAPLVDEVVLSGRGKVPQSLATLPRIPDAPGLAGPLAGILAVMRWQPAVSWLVTACDQPDIRPESLEWLLEARRPGVHAILPDLHADGRIEPLLAWYDSRCRLLLEEIAAAGSLRISGLAGQPGIYHFQPPGNLRSSWHNVNTPAELENLRE